VFVSFFVEGFFFGGLPVAAGFAFPVEVEEVFADDAQYEGDRCEDEEEND
jgi:hypothetical protein